MISKFFENFHFCNSENKEKVMKGEISSPLVPPLQGALFFDRLTEQTNLETLFAQEPRLTLFIGPPSSGKTCLALHLLEKLSHDRPVININLRGISFSNAEELLSVLEQKMDPFLTKVKSLLPQRIKIASFFELEKGPKPGERPISAIERWNSFFEKMIHFFSQPQSEGKKGTPILFIDEAQTLFSLARTKGGDEMLFNLFQWLIFGSKEENFFHVFLASHDSFFHQWVERYVEPIHYQIYLLGDLPKNQAKLFWEVYLPGRHSAVTKGIPTFEEAFKVCGGKMLLLKDYFAHSLLLQKSFASDLFPPVSKEYQRLLNGLYSPEKLFSLFYEEPKWQKEDLEGVIHLLTQSTKGYITYEEAIFRFGANAVRSLIQHQFLYFLPYKTNPENPLEILEPNPIVMPMNAASFRAMQLLLKQKP